ncbi:MAG: GTPase domain-containing protein [Planctomycetaceae bacterium]|nr:GTPase domain-containing protein [Planctomycetaceae bacterium]
MTNQQLEHIALLAEVDDLTARLQKWVDDDVNWDTAQRSRALVGRLLARVETLRFRLETPLVVATFGGTGTGKSTMVNALVGAEVSQTGRQRPTTTTPILLIHPDLEAESLGLDLSQFHVKVVDAPVLRDIVVIDCPDPDTSEGATDGSNLAILRSIVPHCDVLLYASTQQKYKNARVIDELADVASGCRLVFVQTHADLDSDIRDDWKNFLSPSYEVPEMFFVDSLKAWQEQLAHQKPSGDFGRLLDLLASELGTARRVEIRRANLIDLLQEALTVCHTNYQRDIPNIEGLMQALAEQRNQIRDTLTKQLCDELLVNRTLWERRLVSSVTDMWGFSPFSAVLRLYNGLGGLVASFTFFRARTSAQMALIGAMQGARWMKSRAKEQEAESTLERLSNFGISDQQLQESRLVISGHLHSSGIDYESSDDRRDLTDLRKRAASLEDEFLGDASRVIDEVIEKLAVASSHWVTRVRYDIAMMSYVVFLLLRIGYNFFWTSFLAPAFGQRPEAAPLLSVDFYIPALLFLVIWSLLLVSLFTWRLRRGLTQQVQQFATQMADSRLIHGLFPSLEATCRRITKDAERVSGLLDLTTSFRRSIADTSGGFLGGRRDTETSSA